MNTHDQTPFDIDLDPWRPVFHVAPPAGLLNDPNGLVFWQGRHHAFFQWNPKGCTHENKSWGHRASADLVHWETMPIALEPTDWFDAQGCYSGSAVADGDDLVLIYTGNVRDAEGRRETRQCLARSRDGRIFEKLGPVLDGPLPGYTTHFRDPKVTRVGDGWCMVLGAQTEGLHGTVLLLASTDLTRWEAATPLLDAGEHGYMCECPDLFRLDGTDVLLVCEQRETKPGEGSGNVAGWIAGRLDPANGTFDHGAFRRLDHGRDFYAPQTWEAPDGRRLMLAWMGLPEQDDAPTVAAGWLHCLTLPRELRFVDGRLTQSPAAELEALRGPARRVRAPIVAGERDFPELAGETYELAVALDPRETSDLAFDLRVTGEEATTVEIDRAGSVVRLTSRDREGTTVALGAAPLDGPVDQLRIFVDRSSIEVFVGDGRIVLSARIYPSPGATGIRARSIGGAVVAGITFWPLGPRQTAE